MPYFKRFAMLYIHYRKEYLFHLKYMIIIFPIPLRFGFEHNEQEDRSLQYWLGTQKV